MSGILNKVKEAVTGHHSDTTPTSTTSPTGHNTSGPHASDLANKADPRVDSDRDGRSGLTGSSTTSPHDGPHSSGLANKMDPRVDSDHDGRTGLTGSTGTTGRTGYTGSSGTTGYTGTSGVTGSSPHDGPHSSGLLNKMDPRVDSDHDGRSGVTGSSGTTGGGLLSGLTGSGHQHGTTGSPNLSDPSTLPAGITPQGLVHGHHTTVTGEKLDPHVSGTQHGTGLTTSPGGSGAGLVGNSPTGLTGSQNTTSGSGPHSSGLLNKLDPRVDSDGDGSRTH